MGNCRSEVFLMAQAPISAIPFTAPAMFMARRKKVIVSFVGGDEREKHARRAKGGDEHSTLALAFHSQRRRILSGLVFPPPSLPQATAPQAIPLSPVTPSPIPPPSPLPQATPRAPQAGLLSPALASIAAAKLQCVYPHQ